MNTVVRAAALAESDPALLARIVAGDLEALGGLFERYHHDVRRFLLRMGVHSELDDLVQLCFLEVIGAARNYDGRASARGWLLAIAATMVRRQRRSIGRMTARLREWMSSHDQAREELPSETLEGRQAEARLFQALQKLSPKKREVFVMVALEGTSGEEAAAALGIPLNTIWTRLHHARKELRRKLGEALP